VSPVDTVLPAQNLYVPVDERPAHFVLDGSCLSILELSIVHPAIFPALAVILPVVVSKDT